MTRHRAKIDVTVIGWIAGSIAVHILVLFIFNNSFSISLEHQEQEVTQITAKLVFEPPPQVVEPDVIEPILEPDTPKDVEQKVVEELPEVAQESDVPEQPATDEPLVEEIVELPPLSDGVGRRSDLPPISSKDLLRKHMSSINNQQTQRLSENAASEYRRKRISPDFPAAKTDPLQTEEEKLMEEVVVEVDCSGTLNKSVKALAGLLGGMMKCSKPPPFQSFINKRLNKESTGNNN